MAPTGLYALLTFQRICAAPYTVCKRSGNVAEDQRVVVLRSLVARKPRVGAVHRSELVLTNIGDPGCPADEESLSGQNIDCIDRGIAIHVSSR